jgi:hypothetical protein
MAAPVGILIVTATPVESRAVMDVFQGVDQVASGRSA